MSLANYDGLKASVANWLNRTDLATEIPDFIALAESRLAHELRIPTIEKKSVITIDSEGYTTIPADFLEVKDVFFNDTPLSRVSVTQIHSYTARSGVPDYFAREAGKILFFPTPTLSASDRIEMIYYFEVDPLSDSAPTNVLMSTVPELYLYASLSEASKFLGSDGSRWEAAYQESYNRVMSHLRYAEFSGSTPQIFAGYN